MKKIMILALMVGFSWMAVSSAMAKKEPGALPAPGNLQAWIANESLCMKWDEVDNAVKYSVSVKVDVDSDADGFCDAEVKFSFNTADRTDDLDPSTPNLCIPLSSFVYDVNNDGDLEQISGTAYIKVKALNPGKGNGRQNNAFTDWVESALAAPEPLLEDPLLRDPLFN